MPTVTSRRKNAFVVQWSVMAGCIKFRMWSIFGIAELVSFSLLLDFFMATTARWTSMLWLSMG